MIGDCSDCGHSVLYHMPLVGCVKCDCDEFSRYREPHRHEDRGPGPSLSVDDGELP